MTGHKDDGSSRIFSFLFFFFLRGGGGGQVFRRTFFLTVTCIDVARFTELSSTNQLRLKTDCMLFARNCA